MRIDVRIWILVSVLFLASCESWLDVQQEGEVESAHLYDKGEGYRVVLNGLYKAMGTSALYGTNLSYGMIDCMSQQYDMGDKNANANEVYEAFENFNYQDNGVSDVIENTWLTAFNVIANANDLIQQAEQASAELFDEGETERKLILGEAYACRALMHFDMLRLFAPAPVNDDQQTYVPYVEDYPNILATSIQVMPFLDQVIDDLVKAKGLVAVFDTTAVGVEASRSASNRTALSPYNSDYSDFFYGRAYRLSYYSITALLARVCQYAGKYDEAFDYAEEVLAYGTENGGSAFYVDNFDGLLVVTGDDLQAFNSRTDYKSKSNIIFSAYDKKKYDNASFRNSFDAAKTTSGGGASNAFFIVRRVELFKSRGVDEWETDMRSSHLIIPAMEVFPISGKWFTPSSKPEESEHLKMSPVIRLTEMRYIMAECYARKEMYDKAYEILNDVRAKRQLTRTLTQQNSFSEFVTDLTEDARREWISEGQLFYLYKRLDAPLIKNNQSHRLTKAEACLPVPTDQK